MRSSTGHGESNVAFLIVFQIIEEQAPVVLLPGEFEAGGVFLHAFEVEIFFPDLLPAQPNLDRFLANGFVVFFQAFIQLVEDDSAFPENVAAVQSELFVPVIELICPGFPLPDIVQQSVSLFHDPQVFREVLEVVAVDLADHEINEASSKLG